MGISVGETEESEFNAGCALIDVCLHAVLGPFMYSNLYIYICLCFPSALMPHSYCMYFFALCLGAGNATNLTDSGQDEVRLATCSINILVTRSHILTVCIFLLCALVLAMPQCHEFD